MTEEFLQFALDPQVKIAMVAVMKPTAYPSGDRISGQAI